MKKSGKILGTLLTCIIPAGLIPVLTISSCSQENLLDVDMPTVVFDNYFEVDFTLPSAPSSLVKVSLLNLNNPNIRLAENQILLNDQHGKLKFEINIFENFNFKFNICFEYTDKQKQMLKYVTNVFSLLYSYNAPIDTDRVYPVARGITSVNNHSFDFEFNFNISKQISSIQLQLLNETSGKLSLSQSFAEVQYERETYRWFIKVTIILDYSTSATNVYDFDLNLKFTNSFGKQQDTTIKGLSVAYIDQAQPEIPEDMFVLTKSLGDVVLEGVKEEVSPLLLNSFTILRIPDQVNVISSNAFADVNSYENINKIIFNKNLYKVGFNAFGGCTHISELDFENCSSISIPLWLENDIPVFNCEIHTGYIWINADLEYNLGYREKLKTAIFNNCNLPQDWEIFCSTKILPEEALTINFEGVMQGFNPEWFDRLKEYQIIKLPDKVTSFEEDSFFVLGTLPFENPFYEPNGTYKTKTIDTEHKYLTRRLIFSPNISNICDLTFTGIGGLFLLSSQSLSNIGEYVFSDTYDYLPWEIDYHDVYSENASIYFHDCNNLLEIGAHAFTSCESNSDLQIPRNLNKIGESAFADCAFRSITFPNGYLNVEKEAFSTSFSTSVLAHKLEIIDLSSYIWDETSSVEWFEQSSDVFKNSCAPNGIVYFNSSIFIDLKDEAFNKLIERHGIPKTGWKWENKAF